MDTTTAIINCACVIHGDAYSWTYVDRLYNMLTRHLTPTVRLHVYTESNRLVPEPYIKHALTDWSISGPRRSWWYKIQLFDIRHHQGPLLYFDLDTVIVDNIDWIWQLPLNNFWTVQDFKFLWRPGHNEINSSVMWWDTRKFAHIFKYFDHAKLNLIMKQNSGDQVYLTKNIDPKVLRFMPLTKIKSWRWQCLNGGYNFKKQIYQTPGTGTHIEPGTSVLIFHGNPKPDQVTDPLILQHWK